MLRPYMVCFVKMKIAIKLLQIFLAIQIISASPACALDITDRNEYLYDVREDDGNIYRNRLSIHKKLDAHDIDISGFGEAQWNFKLNDWEKLMLGAEVEKKLFKYLYIGQSFQFISGQILDYMTFDVDSRSIDTTTKIIFKYPLLEYLDLKLFEEYSINLEEGRDEYNEIGAEIIYNLKDSCSLGVGWRHTDRIHNLDTDYVTSSVKLRF